MYCTARRAWLELQCPQLPCQRFPVGLVLQFGCGCTARPTAAAEHHVGWI